MTLEEAQIIIGNIPIDGQDECYSIAEYQEAKAIAINIMRKYQKIEEMVKQYKKFGNIDFSMQIICGVVEDGND